MKRARLVFIITIVLMVVLINVLLLAGCGNKYYYNKLYLHIQEVGEKKGESYRIAENYTNETGQDMVYDMYVNRSHSHFIAVTLTNKSTKHSLQLSINPELSGVYSIIPKIENESGNDEYIMCNYNPITKKIQELDYSHAKPENKETILSINDELLDSLLTRFKTYIEAHSAEMDDISMMKLGFEPRPIEAPNTDNNTASKSNAVA